MNATAAPVDTKTRILDAAEQVFSEDGFDAASLRAITAAAQVNLAAVNYHFHSKEALFSAVVARRAAPINKRRIELLESISGKLTPEAILDAFLRPAMERSISELCAFRPLMARLHSAPVDLHKRVLEENFAPTLDRFVHALSTALPSASKEDLRLSMFFIIGGMAHAMAWEPIIAAFIGESPHPQMLENLTSRLVHFGAAGLRASTRNKRVNH